MVLTLEQWREILDTANSNEGYILEQIRVKLKEQDKDTYQKWAQEDFDIDYRFDVPVFITDNLRRCNTGLTLLCIAVYNGHLDIVKYLIENKSICFYKNFFALHYAAGNGHLEIVKYLTEDKKFIPHHNKDDRDEMALHYSARNGHLDTVKYLADNKNSLYQKNCNGYTAVHIAAKHGHLDIVKYIIDDKNVDFTYGICGNTALNLAARGGHLDIVKYLIENKNVNIRERDRYNRDVLECAILSNQLEIVKYLVDDKNISCYFKFATEGSRHLHYAVVNCYLEIVQYLISKGFSINKERHNGRTALHHAAERGLFVAEKDRLEIVQCLIENGANINSEDNNRKTPLDLAAKKQNMAAIELIVNHIVKLEAAGLYVSEENLEKKNEFINTSNERRNNYAQHLRKCKEEIIRLKNTDKSLYDFLIEKDTDALFDIWEKNENLSNKLGDQGSLQKQYPEYNYILINKANEIKKEIFLHNNKPLIDTLSHIYDFQDITLTGIKNFFIVRKNLFREKLHHNVGITLDKIPDFNVERRVVPKLKLTALQPFFISIKQVTKNSNKEAISKASVNSDTSSTSTVNNTESEANRKDSQCSTERNVADNSDTSAISINSNKIIGNLTHSVQSAFGNNQNKKRFSTEVDDKHTVDDIISSNTNSAPIIDNEEESDNYQVEKAFESQEQAAENSSPISDQQENPENNGASDIFNNIPKAVNNKTLEKKNTSFNKSIMTGSVCGVIAALAVSGGCFAAGVALPISALIGIAVATALVVGVIAGGITYSVSRPSDKLDKFDFDLEVANQQVPERAY